jgi:hypothetical protein
MTKTLKTSIGIFLVSFVAQLVVCNSMALKTQELDRVGQEISQVKSRISEVNQRIYLASSITGMDGRAQSMGFLPMDKPVNNVTSLTIARAF